MHLLHSQLDAAQQISQQLGWQDTLVRLFLKENSEVRTGFKENRTHSSREEEKKPPTEELEKHQADKTEREKVGSFASVNGVFDQWSLEDNKSLDVPAHFSVMPLEDASAAEMAFGSEGREELWHSNPSHLSLDLSSVDSYELADVGNQMTDSQPSTPSPTESTKPFSGQPDKELGVRNDVGFTAELSLFENQGVSNYVTAFSNRCKFLFVLSVSLMNDYYFFFVPPIIQQKSKQCGSFIVNRCSSFCNVSSFSIVQLG